MRLRRLMGHRLIVKPRRSARGIPSAVEARRASLRSRAVPCRPASRSILLIRRSPARSAPDQPVAPAVGHRAGLGMRRGADESRTDPRRPGLGPHPERVHPEPLARRVRVPSRVPVPRSVRAPRQLRAVRQVPAPRGFLALRAAMAPSTADTRR
jgi:hypothetical protein